jgi:transposase-like protein
MPRARKRKQPIPESDPLKRHVAELDLTWARMSLCQRLLTSYNGISKEGCPLHRQMS